MPMIDAEPKEAPQAPTPAPEKQQGAAGQDNKPIFSDWASI